LLNRSELLKTIQSIAKLIISLWKY